MILKIYVFEFEVINLFLDLHEVHFLSYTHKIDDPLSITKENFCFGSPI